MLRRFRMQLISFLLVFLLVFSTMSVDILTVSAVETYSFTGGTATSANSTIEVNAADPTVFTDYAMGKAASQGFCDDDDAETGSNTVTFKCTDANLGFAQPRLHFLYKVSTLEEQCDITVADTKYEIRTTNLLREYHEYDAPIAINGTVKVKMETVNPGGKKVGMTFTEVYIYDAAAGHKVTIQPPCRVNGEATRGGTFSYQVSGGTDTVSGTVSSDTVIQKCTADETVTITAVPDSGYKFYGWIVDGIDQNDNSGTLTFTPRTDKTVTGVFYSEAEPLFKVVQTLDFYNSFNSAVEAASSASSKAFVPAVSGTVLPEGDYTIPAGVTLLIPKSGECKVMTEPDLAVTGSASLYRSMIMAEGAHLTVNGSISVAGTCNNASGGGYVYERGPYGRIVMSDGSSITLNSGAKLYAWGFITGSVDNVNSPTVTAKNGSTVYELFQLHDFRGGSITSNMEANKKVFPMNQYYVQNIENKLILEKGATEMVWAALTANGSTYKPTAEFIGSSGLFRIQTDGSTLTKYYNGETDKLYVDLAGAGNTTNESTVDFKLDSIYMSIGSMAANSNEYILPINNMAIDIKDANLSATYPVQLLPDSGITVEAGAFLTIPNGSALYLIGKDIWAEEQPTHGSAVRPLQYIGSKQSYSRRPANGSGMADAYLDVRGKVNVASGAYLSTTNGVALVKSTGETGGEITYAKVSQPPAIYGYSGDSSSVMQLQNLNASYALLKNADSVTPATVTTQGAADNTTFRYDAEDGIWYKNNLVKWKDGNGDVIWYNDLTAGQTPTYEGGTPTKKTDAQYSYTFNGAWSPEVTPVVDGRIDIYTAQFNTTPQKHNVNIAGRYYDANGTLQFPQKNIASNVTYGYEFTPELSTDFQNQIVGKEKKYTQGDFLGWYVTALVPDSSTEVDPVYDTDQDAVHYSSITPEFLIGKYNEGKYTEPGTQLTVTGTMYCWAIYDIKAPITLYEANSSGAKMINDANSSNYSDINTSVRYGTSPTAPAKNATAELTYTFSGWSTVAEFLASSNKTIPAHTADEPMTTVNGLNMGYVLYYSSAPREYTVTWVDGDGRTLYSEQVAYGTTPAYTGEIPTKTGDAQYSYTFSGWSPAIASVTGDTTYTAQFDEAAREYTITWVDGDGNTLKTEQIAYGTTPAYTGEIPTKAEDAQYTYSFAGWDKDIVPVSDDATYTAQFSTTTKTYSVYVAVNYYDNAASSTTWLDDTKIFNKVAYGTAFTPFDSGLTKQERKYTRGELLGWYVTTFVSGTSNVAPVFDTEQAVIAYTSITPEFLIGKYNEGKYTEPGTQLTVTGTMYCWAIYDIKAPIKLYEANGNSASDMEKHSSEYSDLVTSVRYGTSPAAPTKNATAQLTYTFSGWSTVAEFLASSNKTIPAHTADEPMTTVNGLNMGYVLYYSSAPREYTVTWLDGNGDTLKTEQVAYGQTPAYTGEIPTKTGDAQYSYTFSGWSPAIASVTGDATYTAQFDEAAREYTITWVDGDGNTLKTEQIAYGTTPAYTGEIPTKTATEQYAYSFNNTWSPAITSVTGDVTYTAQFDAEIINYFLRHSLTLNGDIGVNFYVTLTEEQLAQNPEVSFELNGEALPTYTIDAARDRKVTDGMTLYKATCYVCSPEMTDSIYAALTVGGNEIATDTYSVKTYADKIINDENQPDDLKTLVTAMLNYGGAAQIQFADEHPDNTKMANEGLVEPEPLTAEEIGAINTEKPDKNEINSMLGGTGLSYYGYTMLLHSKTTLRFYFLKENSGIDISGIHLSIGTGDDKVTYDAKNYNDWFAYVDAEGIPAYELNNTYELSVNGTALGSYSVLTYVKDVLSDDTASKTLSDTVTALYRYHEAAVTYFNHHQND